MDSPARNGEPRYVHDRRTRFVSMILFLGFLIYMFTNHNGDVFLARHQYQEALQSLNYQLSNYTLWLNGTASNFTLPETDPSLPPLMETFHVKGSLLDPRIESYYRNITGFVHGDAQFTNISLPSLALNETLPWRHLAQDVMTGANTTNMTEKLGSWGWNTTTKVALSVVEKKPAESAVTKELTSSIALVHGRIELTDPSEEDNLRLEFEGVHFVSNGSIYGFAEPPGRHIDIRLLPSLVPEGFINQTAQVIEPELQARIDKLKKLIDDGVLDTDSSNDDAPRTACPFIFYAQIQPTQVPEHLMRDLEDELQNPTGITTVSAPKLWLKGLLLSKECGVLYEITNTEGLRSRTFFRKVTTYAGTTAIAYLIMLILFSRQADQSSTPSGISRVSCYAFEIQPLMDLISFAGHITFAILSEGRSSFSLIAPAFLALVVSIYEAQFAILVHSIQRPEDYVRPPFIPAAVAAFFSPAPAGQTQNNRPASFLAFFVNHVRTDTQTKIWLMSFICWAVIVRVILSPTLSKIFLVLTYSTIWMAQIWRSASRGRSSGLSKEYILGTTACRLYLALYFLGCPKNVLEVETRSWIWPLAVFVVLQATVVILQDTFGPTFFLSQKYANAKIHDYHPYIPLPDSESPEKSLGDCAICMDSIIIAATPPKRPKYLDGRHSESDSTEESASGSVFSFIRRGVGANKARKNYSLAPCSHLFHTECLERWLAIKNICPQCRRPLPPL
ncbi:DSC E3 ubiquitin ligase complex subunit 1 [Psilocybe cubensis]|uniref:RING-type E3 ubiquitin transferase n=2 Tax=Psilocybe cubensis TaxID=181762 RepID=A0A8H7XVH1_PSICU|nr:DSC E3 ubiquitin ligase complex subunit 1 [Psilocybe cubensis]KAH9479483.1 DSC E3 ubiquitin ligase complex subunit 1 [Psilocybe cubensis]